MRSSVLHAAVARGSVANLGRDPVIVRARTTIEQAAPGTATVLFSGEAGTGKRLAALALHANSPRAQGPFVRLHCAGLRPSMLESEIFGRDADSAGGIARAGRLERAQGGSLLLEEIAQLPLGVQGRLLHFLDERTVLRVGGRESIRLDVRVLATTRRKLHEEVAAGRFRDDLFQRLIGVHVELPPLRERRADILPLANALLERLAEAHGRPVYAFTAEAQELLCAHHWPGNVRELEDAIERAIFSARECRIDRGDLEAALDVRLAQTPVPLIPGATLAEIERVAILRTLEKVGGSTSRAAAMLGISTRKIQYRIREYREAGLLGDRSGARRAP